MAFPRQKDLDKVAHHAQLDQLARVPPLVHGHGRIRRSDGFAAGNKVLLPDAPGHLGEGESLQSPAHIPSLVAIGEPAHKKRVERRAGDHPELAEFGNRLGQAPVGDAHAHAALNDLGKLHHV